MILEAIVASVLVAVVSIVGVLFFGNKSVNFGQKYIAPIAVGVFMSLVLFELIPETLALSPVNGGIAVAAGFILFYIISSLLHNKYHCDPDEDCTKKGSAMLILIGDAVHNIADGVILGGAFLIDPAVGIATAVGLALHEIPQEIIEFGVLVRSGISRGKAVLLNLLSASSIIVGTILILLIAEHADQYIWLITGIAAGNLLFLAASDLLPRIHGHENEEREVWKTAISITLGFAVMTGVLIWTHEQFGHGHDNEHEETALHDDHHDENH